MFDFDELSGEEDAAEKRQPAAVPAPKPKPSTAYAPPAAPPAAPRTAVEAASPAIRVVVTHAIQGWTLVVVLPEKALFRHLKRGLARHFLKDKAASFRGQLMRKEGGIYSPHKEKAPIGAVREVLLAGFDPEHIPSPDEEIILGEEDLEEDVAPGLEKFLALQKELLGGFSEPEFQEELCQLQTKCERRELVKTKFLAERQKLFLKVQMRVLPRYGYEGSSSGVYKMMGDMRPFIKEPEFVELADKINALLGINYSPPETWDSLSDNCQKLNDEKVGPRNEVDSDIQQRRARQESRSKNEFRPPLGLLSTVPSLLNGKPLRLPDSILQGLP